MGPSPVSMITEQRGPWDAWKSHSGSDAEPKPGKESTRKADPSGEGTLVRFILGQGVEDRQRTCRDWGEMLRRLKKKSKRPWR